MNSELARYNGLHKIKIPVEPYRVKTVWKYIIIIKFLTVNVHNYSTKNVKNYFV